MERLSHYVEHVFWRHVRHGAQYRRDAAAMQALAPLASPYLPWTHFAMRPGAVVTILNDIAVNRRTHIVECGGGISTVYIGRLLRERGGHLFTIEESAEWASSLSRQIDKEHLSDHVSIAHAPIADVRLGGATERWYSTEVVDDLIGGKPIDLLIVDGPLAEHHPLTRYPALPYLHRSLQAGATVVVDDIDRPGEQQIVKRWEDERGLSFERRFLNGIAVATVART